MADYCAQCSEELFGPEFADGDLRPNGSYKPDAFGMQMAGLFYSELCEGCGACLVDWQGRCIGGCAVKHHKDRFRDAG
jgi:ferredoxin